MPSYDYNDYNNEDDQENEISRRSAWEIASWVIMALTLLLNLIVIIVLLARENAYSVVNKGKETNGGLAQTIFLDRLGTSVKIGLTTSVKKYVVTHHLLALATLRVVK